MNQGNQYDALAVMPEIVASGLAVPLCTITTPPDAFDDGGAPIASATWPVLTGHVDIPCMQAPQGGNERKTPAEILSTDLHTVLLTGYFPDIITSYRATVDGVVYDILNAQSDSQQQMTHLVIQLATI